jgi:hypothetical protein
MEQVVVRNNMDVKEHEKLSNFTLKTQNKVKYSMYLCIIHTHTHLIFTYQ